MQSHGSQVTLQSVVDAEDQQKNSRVLSYTVFNAGTQNQKSLALKLSVA